MQVLLGKSLFGRNARLRFLAVVFLAGYLGPVAAAQNLSLSAERVTQMSVRALQQSRPGEMELPRVLPLRAMVKISRRAKARVRGRRAIQPTADPATLLKGARRSLSTLKHVSYAIGSLYRGKGYVPPGVNYFTLERRKPSDRGFRQHLGRSGLKPVQVVDIAEMTIAFENSSDLYAAVEGLLRADQRGFLKLVGFSDSFLTPRLDGDRSIVTYVQLHGHVSTLRLELSPFLKARVALRGERRLAVRRLAFQKAFSACEKNYVTHRTRVMRFNARIAPEILKQYDAIAASIQTLEANRSVLEARGLIPRSADTPRSRNTALNLNPEGTLCPNWNQVAVNHQMPSADKLRTFLWGLSQPPCSEDRIRSGHLLYQKLTETYAGFQWSSNPEHLAQQRLLRSVYFATADYLRARPTAPNNQMCRPEEKVRIYRGVGAMPLVRSLGAKTGLHLAPLFGDQLIAGLRIHGLLDDNGSPLVPNRDTGELSAEHRHRMTNLTWDFIEGVPHGWKFVLGLQRSSGWDDKNKDGVPEDDAGSGPLDPVPFPGPVILPHPGGAVLETVVPTGPLGSANGPLDGPTPIPGTDQPEPIPEEPIEDETQKWNEPGKHWYKMNGQLQRVLTMHTGTSTYSPFLSTSFSENMGRGYGPLMIVMDVCPERILPNFEPSGSFVSEEELYVPFFVLPEEIVRIEGRECWLAQSRPGLDKLTPEEQQKHYEAAEKICSATYHKSFEERSEPVNRVTHTWRSYFRNFMVDAPPLALQWTFDTPHLIGSQKKFYSILAQGLKPSPLNPAGEMTLARWRDIARQQIRGFYSCDTSKRTLARLEELRKNTQEELERLVREIKERPHLNDDVVSPGPIPEPVSGAVGVVEPLPTSEIDGVSATTQPLESIEPPPAPEKDWRVEEVERLKVQLQQTSEQIATEKKASASQCGSL